MYLSVFILKDDFTDYKILFYLAVLHGKWDLSSLTKKLTCAPRVKAQCLNHWTTREVLWLSDSWFTYLFGFSTLNMSFHCLLTFIISDEKSAVNLFGISLWVRSCFSLAVFKIFTVDMSYICMMSLSAFLHGICWASWKCRLL